MGYTPPAAAGEAIANDLTLTVYDLDTAAAYAAAARAQGRTVRVHVKLDSGMGRLGIAAEEGPGLRARRCTG